MTTRPEAHIQHNTWPDGWPAPVATAASRAGDDVRLMLRVGKTRMQMVGTTRGGQPSLIAPTGRRAAQIPGQIQHTSADLAAAAAALAGWWNTAVQAVAEAREGDIETSRRIASMLNHPSRQVAATQ